MGEVEIERCFFVEAKNFVYSVLEGESVTHLEERRRGYAEWFNVVGCLVY